MIPEYSFTQLHYIGCFTQNILPEPHKLYEADSIEGCIKFCGEENYAFVYSQVGVLSTIRHQR